MVMASDQIVSAMGQASARLASLRFFQMPPQSLGLIKPLWKNGKGLSGPASGIIYLSEPGTTVQRPTSQQRVPQSSHIRLARVLEEYNRRRCLDTIP